MYIQFPSPRSSTVQSKSSLSPQLFSLEMGIWMSFHVLPWPSITFHHLHDDLLLNWWGPLYNLSPNEFSLNSKDFDFTFVYMLCMLLFVFVAIMYLCLFWCFICYYICIYISLWHEIKWYGREAIKFWMCARYLPLNCLLSLQYDFFNKKNLLLIQTVFKCCQCWEEM